MSLLRCYDQLVDTLRSTLAGLSDKRTGSNTQYTMEGTGNQTILGDDLYARQPFCRQVLLNNTLKKSGYHLDHAFGHGKAHLCTSCSPVVSLQALKQTELIPRTTHQPPSQPPATPSTHSLPCPDVPIIRIAGPTRS